MHRTTIVALCLSLLVATHVSADDRGRSLFAGLTEKLAGQGAIRGITIAPHPGAVGVVAVVNENNRVSVLFGEGRQWTILRMEKQFAGRPRVVLRDLNADGVSELLVCDEQVEVYKIGKRELVRVWSSDDDMFGAAVGNSNGFLWLMRLEGDGLEQLQRWKTPSGGAIGPALRAGNMDRDAAAELLIGTNGGDIFVLEFDQYANAVLVASATAGRLAYGVNAADIDGDGIDEFISSRGNIGYAKMTSADVAVEIWKPNGDKTMNRIWHRLTVDNPRTLIHDVDGDGTSEIIAFSDFGSGDKIEVLSAEVKEGS